MGDIGISRTGVRAFHDNSPAAGLFVRLNAPLSDHASMTELSTGDVRKLLSAHGHAFHHAVLRRAEQLVSQRTSPWIFEAAEYPVGAADAPVHVDLILRGVQSTAFIVGECKRADPGKARWCFVQTPYTHRNPSTNELIFQQVRIGDDSRPRARPFARYASMPHGNLAFEARSTEKGDGVVPAGALRDAIAQVLRGMNGLIDDMFVRRNTTLRDQSVAVFVPAIFTTASLFHVTGDIGEAELQTGRLPDAWGEIQQVDWMWFTHNQSPSLIHHLDGDSSDSQELAAVLRAQYCRSIAIVSPSGIDRFLSRQLLEWL